MRKFSSYGPLDPELHYYVDRKVLVNQAFTQLVGENPDRGGHYMTVWGTRQAGKSWIMQQVYRRLLSPSYAESRWTFIQWMTSIISLSRRFLANRSS